MTHRNTALLIYISLIIGCICNFAFATSPFSSTTTTLDLTTTPEPSPELEFFSYGQLDDANSCELRCPSGFYQLGGLSNEVCRRHSVLSCAVNEYFQAGTHHFDAKCNKCTGCEGQRSIYQCANESNDVCEPCLTNADTDPHGKFVGENCEVICDDNYVLNKVTQRCEFCSAFKCTAGFKTPRDRQNCTHCEICTNKVPYSHWILDEDREDCSWECDPNYALNVNAHSVECLPQQLSYDIQLAHEALNLKCKPGETLYNFKCTSCWEAPQIAQSSLSLKETHKIKWEWIYECTWSCFRMLGYQKFKSLTHWDCIQSTRRDHLIMGDNFKTDWTQDLQGLQPDTTTANNDATNNPTQQKKRTFFWIFIASGSLPITIMIINVVLSIIRNTQRTSKSSKEPNTIVS